jgi:hypothetical protein
MEYDVNLYKKIADFKINEVVTVTNRNGRKTTIHITNLTKLSWHELQLLSGGGSNKFGKMVYLYEKYKEKNINSDPRLVNVTNGEKLSESETNEISRYVKIFRNNNFENHTEINNYITENGIWDDFPTIRSINDHGEYKNIPGILPKYFEIVCSILKINGDKGAPLTRAIHY